MRAGWIPLTICAFPLRALTSADSERLVDTLLGYRPEPRAVAHADSGTAPAAIPFFAEELVQSMVEANIRGGRIAVPTSCAPNAGEIAVPDSVHAVLATRIDRLDERHKETPPGGRGNR